MTPSPPAGHRPANAALATPGARRTRIGVPSADRYLGHAVDPARVALHRGTIDGDRRAGGAADRSRPGLRSRAPADAVVDGRAAGRCRHLRGGVPVAAPPDQSGRQHDRRPAAPRPRSALNPPCTPTPPPPAAGDHRPRCRGDRLGHPEGRRGRVHRPEQCDHRTGPVLLRHCAGHFRWRLRILAFVAQKAVETCGWLSPGEMVRGSVWPRPHPVR